jgi:hypothetical protein
MGEHNLLMDHPYLLNNHYILHAWPCNSVSLSAAALPPILSSLIKGASCGDEEDVGDNGVSVEKLDLTAVSEAGRVYVELK